MQHANKAWVGALVAGLSALLVSLQGNEELDTLSLGQWVVVVLSAVVAALTVYIVPNRGSS